MILTSWATCSFIQGAGIMKNLFLTIITALTLTACSSGLTSIEGGSQTPAPPTPTPTEEEPETSAPPIAPPTLRCRGTDCFTGVSSLNAGYYATSLSGAYSDWKSWISILSEDFDIMNALLKEKGYTTCGAIPISGTMAHPTLANYSLEFKAPTLGFDMGTGHGYKDMEKRLTVSKSGVPELEVEVHCGSGGTVQTAQVIWLHYGDPFNFNYEYDTVTERVNLSAASVWPTAGGSVKYLFGFRNEADGGFGLFNYVNLEGDRIFSIMQTVPGSPQNMEYAVAIDNGPASSTWTIDDIDYGSDFADDFERVCTLGFRGSSPTYTIHPTDCGTAGKIANAYEWLPVAGLSSGTVWTSQYLDDLTVLDIPD